MSLKENKELRDQVASFESRLLQASRRILAHNMRGEQRVGDDSAAPSGGSAVASDTRLPRGESIDSTDLNWSFNRGSGDGIGGGFFSPPPTNGDDEPGAGQNAGKSIFDEITRASREEVRAYCSKRMFISEFYFLDMFS